MELNYTFVNPNPQEVIENALRQLIVEKLLSLVLEEIKGQIG